MPTANPKKKPQQPDRLNFRLAPEIKARVVRAAALTGQALTDFAVSTLSEKANEIITRYESIVLNKADYQFFLNALDETSKPSARARSAAERYRKGRRKGVRYHLAD